MALFSKPPAKKPPAPKAESKVRPIAPGARPFSAREVLSEVSARGGSRAPSPPADEPTSTHGKLVERAPHKPPLAVDETANGLVPVLENAALMYASGQANAARALLEESVAGDPEAKTSAFAWLCLFDLVRRDDDRAAFDALALQYVVAFERSAPGWEELGGPGGGPRTSAAGGTLALAGKLTAATGTQLEALRQKGNAHRAELKVDLAAVQDYDDEGARLLAQRLADARHQRVPLVVVRAEKLRQRLETAANEGREAGQGAWMLLLELLQWLGEHAAFEDRAVEFAVTFEMSPPSWEPLSAAGPAAVSRAERPASIDAETLGWTDTIISGATPPQVKSLLEFAQTRSNVVLDMLGVDRMDFASAGALANAISRVQGQKKTLQVTGAGPIVRALLLLVGVRADIFVRRST
ncbi:MAG: STAS domain-containing protein [Pseudomonadota bacterium]|nr:STAS domain-containing protein [Pseudomonadota bacterium]